MSGSPELRRILLEAWVLVACGVLIGLSLHHELVLDAFSGQLASPTRPGVVTSVIDRLPVPVLLEDVRKLAAEGGVLVDARDWEPFAEGHLPGAVSLPLADVDNLLSRFRQAVQLDRPLVIYCNGYGCPDSYDLALRLIKAGYLDVRVFEGGYPEWRDAGLPVERGES
ncbi:MAG: rhodanese-like domain-containing protein [Desulfuromonas sp.]|nr:MAG: rhodanese-like domain-containing protein [Desulfuromonas sp.]